MMMYCILLLFGVFLCGEAQEESDTHYDGKVKIGNKDRKANKKPCNCTIDDHKSTYNAMSPNSLTLINPKNATTGSDRENKTFINRMEDCTTLCRLYNDFEYNLSRSMDGVSDGSNVSHIADDVVYKDSSVNSISNLLAEPIFTAVVVVVVAMCGIITMLIAILFVVKRDHKRHKANTPDKSCVPLYTDELTDNAQRKDNATLTIVDDYDTSSSIEPDRHLLRYLHMYRGMISSHEITERTPFVLSAYTEHDGRNSKEYGCNSELDEGMKPSVNKTSDGQDTVVKAKCIVKPLQSPDPKAQEDTAPVLLNWDKIFRFLVGNLPASNYKLFFNILFESCREFIPSGTDISSYIKYNDNLQNGMQTVMCELFQQWKQLMGSKASIACIDTALKEMTYNDVSAKLEEFMRNPPVLPTQRNATECQAVCLNEMENTEKPASKSVPYVPPSVQCIFMVHNTQQPYNQVAHTRGAEATSSLCGEIPLASGSNSTLFTNSLTHDKRKPEIHVDDVHQEEMQLELSPRKKLEIMHTVKRSSFERKRFRNEDPTDYDEMKQCLINMTMRILPMSIIPLERKEYDIFLEHIISCILKETGESRDTVLLLRHRNFRDIELFETKKKDKMYFIYSGNTCLVLRQPQYEKLELYVKYARNNLLENLKATTGDDFREPEALFITHDCQPGKITREIPIARVQASSNITKNRSSIF